MIAPRFLLVTLALTWGTTLPAEPPTGDGQQVQNDAGQSAGGRFLRVERNRWGRPLGLQTAIVRYVPASGEGDLVVDLVASVHIGDRSYYRELNKRFEEYDVVLYELVAPHGRLPKRGARDSSNPLVMLQQMAESVLELESQTEHIDYSKANFIHADMSPQEMQQAIRERGDDGLTLLLSITADLMRQQNLRELKRRRRPPPTVPTVPVDPLVLLFDPDRPATLKQMLAEQFEEMESAGLGDTLNRILVEDRNKAALRVFQTELAKGKKRIAIFYGAGHMPDLEKRFVSEFGLRRGRLEWLTAWSLHAPRREAR